MARVVIVGGGAIGLCGALLLGKDGHQVTVLERDPAAAAAPGAAWGGLGAARRQPVPHAAPLRGAVRQPDARERARGHRRAARRRSAADEPVPRRPGRVHGRVPRGRRPVRRRHRAPARRRGRHRGGRRGEPERHGPARRRGGGPAHRRARGARRTARDRRAHRRRARRSPPTSWSRPCGRRSMLPKLLTDIGARAPIEEKEDCGFVYWGRHFRSADGSLPPMLGGAADGLRLHVDPHPALRQRHLGGGHGDERQGRRAAQAVRRRHLDEGREELSPRRPLARG